MPTLLEVSERALRLIGVVDGAENIGAREANVTIEALKDMLARLPEYGGGRALTDVSASSAITAREDERVVCSASLSLTLPLEPRDGARVAIVPVSGTVTVKRNGRKLEGGTADVSVTTAATYAYRADLADWTEVTALTSSSALPLPDADVSAIRAILAHLIADEFDGATIPANMPKMLTDAESYLRAKYNRPREKLNSNSLPQSVRGAGRMHRYGYS